MAGNYRIDIYINGDSSGGTRSSNGANGTAGAAAGLGVSGIGGLSSIAAPNDITDFYVEQAGLKVGQGVFGGLAHGFANRGQSRSWMSKAQEMNIMQKQQRSAGLTNLANKTAGIGLSNLGASDVAAQMASESFANARSAAMIPTKYTLVRTAAYASTRVGVWTGDSVRQSKVNNIMKVVGAGLIATKNPVLGAAGIGLEIGFHAIDYTYKRTWDGRTERENQRRTGLARYNRNRGVRK